MLSHCLGAFLNSPLHRCGFAAIPPNCHVLRFWQPVWWFNWKNWAKQLKSKFSPSRRNARPPRVPFPWPVCHPLIKCLNLLPIFYSRPNRPQGFWPPTENKSLGSLQVAIFQNVPTTLIWPFSPLAYCPSDKKKTRSQKQKPSKERWSTRKQLHCYYV